MLLIIDDETPIREAIEDILDLIDMQSIGAADGAEGLVLFQEHHAELSMVLLDMQMPGMDGATTYREIRKLAPDIPIIITSGYSQTKTLTQIDQEKAIFFLQKPLALNTLIETVESIIQMKNS